MTEQEAIQGIKVTMPETEGLRYFWVAEYNDGVCLPQYDESGRENLFGDVEQHKLIRFHFINFQTNHKVSVNITPDMRLICFRRHRQLTEGVHAPHTPGHDVFYSLGYQKTIVLNGQEHNVQSIMFIDGDGNVTLSDGVKCQ